MNKDKSVTIRISSEVWALLTEEANKRDVSVSQIIRECVYTKLANPPYVATSPVVPIEIRGGSNE